MNDKSISDKNMVLSAANKSGFNLEFRTRKLLEELNYSCEQNKCFKDGNDKIEIDVIGKKQGNTINPYPIHLIIECKGISTDGCLILIKSSSDKINGHQGKARRNDICYNESYFYFPCFYLNSNDCCYTITGDFFNRSKSGKMSEYKKCSTQDDSNNFYKAQIQILAAIKPYAVEENRIKSELENDVPDLRKIYICPLIITNCPIWVIDYNGNEATATEYKGALQYITESPYALPVINIEYLKEIVESIEQQCGYKKIQLPLSLDEK